MADQTAASTSDLPATLGSHHCAFPTCRALDFLPQTCAFCKQIYCSTHSLPPSAHACTATIDNIAHDGGRKFEDKFNDLLPDPKRNTGMNLQRDKAARELAERKAAARTVLEKNFGRDAVDKMASSAPRPAAGKQTVVSPVVALMKLKQRAVPVDEKSKKLPMDERIYVVAECRRGPDHTLIGEKVIWLAKSITVGRALDQIATLYKVQNVNNVSVDPSKLLSLASASDLASALPTSVPLSSVIQNGGRVVLQQGR